MNKREQIEARRELLRRWIFCLTEAYEESEQQIQSLLDAANGGAIQVPMMKVEYPSSDMMNVLVSGLKRAIGGDPDPFQLKSKGIKPLLNQQERIDLAIFISREVAKGKPTECAFTTAEHHFNVSSSTARDAYYEQKEWAEIYLHVEKTRYNK